VAFPDKPAVLLCHCETFVVANLTGFRDVRKVVFAVSVCTVARVASIFVGKF